MIHHSPFVFKVHHLKDKRYIKSLKNEAIPLHQAQETEVIPRDISIGTESKFKDGEQIQEIEAEERSESSEGDTASVTSEYEIGQEFDPAPAEATIFRCFKKWLMSLDGSAKKDRDARLHVAQLAFISKSINGDQENDDVLKLIDGDLVRDRWLENFRKTAKPGTVKAYLHSLRFFANFLKFQESLISVEQERLVAFEGRVQLWLKSLNKSLNRRKWEKRDEDLERIATPTDYVTFDQSEQVRHAIKVLSSFMGANPGLYKADYTCVRDYLLSTLIMDNASRSGAVAGLRIQDVKKATKEGDTMVMTVVDHKTLDSTGPAVLGTSLVTFQYLDIFISKMRARIAQITGSKSDNVFLSFLSGKPMNSSNVSDRLGSFWRQAVGKHMNATLIRKSSVSVVHKDTPDKRGELATLMNHSVKTAENVYFIASKKQTSARASSYLRGAMRNTTDAAEEKEKITDKDEESDERLMELFPKAFETGKIRMREVRDVAELSPELKGKERAIYERIRYIISKQKKTEVLTLPSECEEKETRLRRIGIETERIDELEATDEVAEENDSESLFDDEEEIIKNKNPHSRVAYTAKQNKMIADIFKKQIETTETIMEEHVAKKFKANPVLRDLGEQLTSKQLCDKIRAMRRAFRLKNKKK